MNKKTAYSYYFIIILIIALWNGIGVEVPIVLRFAYLVIVYLPLLKWRELLPAVFFVTLSITHNAFTAPLLPTSDSYYIIVLFVFIVISSREKLIVPQFIYIFIFLLVFFVDIILQNYTTFLVTKILLCLMIYVSMNGDFEKCKEHMPYAFMMISVVLSYWILFRYEARIVEMHVVEGFEERGGWTDPNYLGSMIVIGCTVAINELINSRKTILKVLFCYLTIIISIFALAYLASRGAFVALAVGSVVLLLLSKINKKSKFVFLVIIIGFLFFMFKSSYFDVAIARFQSESMETGTGRTLIWERKLNAFFTESSLWNVLFGYSLDEGMMLGHFGKAKSSHNDFVAVLVEYGFIGLILYIYVFVCAIKQSSKFNRPVLLSFLLTYIAIGMTLEPTFSSMHSSVVFVFFIFYILMFSRSKEVLE